MAKVPGAKPREKVEPMLGPEYGIGSNGEASRPPTFAADHQLPTPDDETTKEGDDDAPEHSDYGG